MKILSKKKYEKLQQAITNLQMDYNDSREQIRLYDEQVDYLQKDVSARIKVNDALKQENEEKSKEIRRLKTLLTKNGISYKKEGK